MTHVRLLRLLLIPALVVILCGCVACELRVTNHTGGSIQFYTGHTKKVVRISSGATATIPHASGRVIIITEQDEVWEYGSVDVPDLDAETKKGFQRLTLPLAVGAGGIVILPSGRKIEPTQKMQPQK